MGQDELIRVLRRRTWAGWIDVLILAVVGVIISAITGNAHVGHWTTSDGVYHSGFAFNLPTGPFLFWLLIVLFYYSVDEVVTGQTIGKRAMGLKVIRIDGHPLDGRTILIRTLWRIVDGLPVFYLVGWIAMRGPRRPPQRLGDRFAGTAVVPVAHP